MLEKAGMKITEDEAKLYDRQIRLWGLDAQKRLRSARVLVSGLRGLGCEVAKNLVLAGVRAITLNDNQNLTLDDRNANFLAPRDKVGENRAVASIDRLTLLNPMVEMITDTTDIAHRSVEFFKQFDIVVVTGRDKEELSKINSCCREADVNFFAGDVVGFFGYSFMDLIEHEYLEEVKVQGKHTAADVDGEASGDEPPAKKAKVDSNGNDEKAEGDTKMEKHSIKFVPLKDALRVDWSDAKYAKRVQRMDPSFFILQILFEFHSREGRFPSLKSKESDLKLLEQLRDSVTSKFELPEKKIPASINPLLFSELSPVAAIVGGVLAQEVIKTISNKDRPHKNFFLFNPLQSAGVVEIVE